MTDGLKNAIWLIYYLYIGFVVAFTLKAVTWWGMDWAGGILLVLLVPGVLLQRIARRSQISRLGWGGKVNEENPKP